MREVAICDTPCILEAWRSPGRLARYLSDVVSMVESPLLAQSSGRATRDWALIGRDNSIDGNSKAVAGLPIAAFSVGPPCAPL